MEHNNNNNNNSDTSSSAETDHNPPENHGGGATSSGGARSYECSFCKRGFTNAQALGGHMNIHRKDKAKAKPTKPKTHQAQFPLIQTFNSNDLDNGNNPVFGGRDMSYQVYFPPSDRIIQTGTTNFQYHDYFPVQLDDRMDGNLSLRIGLSSCPPVEDHDQVEDHIDLELRLGQYP